MEGRVGVRIDGDGMDGVRNTPLYEKGKKKHQNKSMETTVLKMAGLHYCSYLSTIVSDWDEE